eukprot:CAMPEP_0184440302 /NCGR_PEP_ID=MMETSP0738-20130409/755489_1 /TAXON_ID=385413 /ORGANISM="Thalassiosira miniscula, Strain CCMP1093" /LENGTH=45 /DNA_ID= /DNA_START= /DNA_END= /DNA_ORIENTATION=
MIPASAASEILPTSGAKNKTKEAMATAYDIEEKGPPPPDLRLRTV